MKVNRPSIIYLRLLLLVFTVCSIILLLCSVCGLFFIKYNVRESAKVLHSIQQDISKTERSIHMLNAEWMYLIRPENIERVYSSYFDGMRIIRSSDRVTIKELTA